MMLKTDGFYLPILMYHGVSDEPENGVSSYYRTSTSPKAFAEHMTLLRAEGYEAVSLAVGLQRLRCAGAALGKLVALTFDDGFRDFRTTAFPILQQYGFGATVFLPTAFIGCESRRFKTRECMTWSEVRELRKAGIEFGSHTVNHPTLYELDRARLRTELEASKATIEEELGEPIRSFAYPYAFPSADRRFVDTFVELLKDARYECGVTTRIGRARPDDPPFTLKRLPVNSTDDGRLFLAKLTGAYDWMTLPQDSFKCWKRFVFSGRNGYPAARVEYAN
jgi:peptidoglycan/xylan/chitin deacetylase (PgdA/CDA1 family)